MTPREKYYQTTIYKRKALDELERESKAKLKAKAKARDERSKIRRRPYAIVI